jgi:hypothetical protein
MQVRSQRGEKANTKAVMSILKNLLLETGKLYNVKDCDVHADDY